MRFIVKDSQAELDQVITGAKKVHYPNRDGSAPICGSVSKGSVFAIRRQGQVTCKSCSGILMAERLWRRRGLCVRPQRASDLAA